MEKAFTLVAYEFESAMGKTIRNAVVCYSEAEYERVVEKMKRCDVRILYFDEIFPSSMVPRDKSK